jgi:hypothetical protein
MVRLAGPLCNSANGPARGIDSLRQPVVTLVVSGSRNLPAGMRLQPAAFLPYRVLVKTGPDAEPGSRKPFFEHAASGRLVQGRSIG